MSRRAFALQGIGFGRRFVALQGFARAPAPVVGVVVGRNRRAIAVQGIGFSRQLVALMGFPGNAVSALLGGGDGGVSVRSLTDEIRNELLRRQRRRRIEEAILLGLPYLL